MIRVVKRDGRIEKLDISKIQKYTRDSVKGLAGVSQSELEVDANLHFRDMMSTKDIQETLIKTAVDKIDVDRPNWTFVASRLFLYDLYHKVGRNVGGIKGKAYFHLRLYFEKGEEEGRVLLGLKDRYDLDDLNDYIDPSRDLQFTYLGIKTLYDRYLLKDKDAKPIELPQHLFMGVAMFLAQNEADCQSWAKKFYDILSKFEVMAATPTLSNARTPRHQLSSCFIKGTKVRTIQGYKDIDKIDIGDMVLTHKNRFKKVYELFVRDYSKNLISLKINGLISNLEATEEHPILSFKREDIKCIRKLKHCILNQSKNKICFALKGEYKDDCDLLDKKFSSKWNKIEDLNKGDFVSISYPKYIGKDTIYISDYVRTKNIVVHKNKIMFKRSSASFYSCERSFFNNQISSVINKIKLDSDFMLLLGYFLAEGYISKDLNQITFTFGSKEIKYIEETKTLIEKIFGIEVRVNENRDNSTNVSVHNKIIALFFFELVGTGFNKKILNNDILFANPKVQKSLLIGVIRGDGCALEEGYQLTMSNEKLIKQLFEIALRCGLSPYMKTDAKKHKWATVKASHLKISSRGDKEFVLSVDKNIQNIKFNQSSKSTLRYFWFENEYFMRIIDKEERYIEEKVYNIEVEDDHSYSVAGVNVHNCYIGSTPDNIEGIFDAYKEMALLSKFGGGIGWDWSQVRGMGSYIDGHKHAAGGIVPFLKIANDVAIAVDQLGCVAKNSFVKVLSRVKTDNFEHDFRREYQKIEFTNKELIEGVASYASSFAFEYGKFSKNFISSLIFDYIMNLKGSKFLEDTYGLSHDQYKKIIGRYKKIEKGLPIGFETIIDYPYYAISPDGVIINRVTLRPLATSIDRKGYVRVTLGKDALTIHLLLAKQYLGYSGESTIDHIDGNKLNNRLENLQVLSNIDNISKGWDSTYKKRTEKARIRRHLSFGHRLKGDRRDTHDFKILDIQTKIIPIEEIRIGDLILSYNISDNRVEYKAVTAKHNIDVEIKDQIKISFEDGNYIITSNWHPFPKLIDGKVIYTRSDSINIGDITINDSGDFIKVSDIQKGRVDREFVDLTVKDNNNYFCSTDNQEGNFHLIHNTRRGAIAVYIEPWHIDVKEFLDLKKNSGEERRRAHDLFPALWLNDIFMQRVQEDNTWTLFDPYEVRELTDLYGEEFTQRYLELEQDSNVTKEVISAKALWKEILRSYFETGNPFLTFKDSANRANPNKHNGIIRSSNLCVTGDTKILTKKYGYIEIKKVAGKKLECWNGKEWSKTDIFQTSKSQKVLKVKLSSQQTIEATPYHKWAVVVQNKFGENIGEVIKRTYELEAGDKLAKFDLEPISHGSKELEFAYENGFYSNKRDTVIKNNSTIKNKILKDRYFIPNNEYSIQSRLNWLAGYIDRDGILVSDNNSQSIQIVSTNNNFLLEIRLLLQELGVYSNISYLEYNKYKLSIENLALNRLISLGYRGDRIKPTKRDYNSYDVKFIKVESIIDDNESKATYCGTEPKRNRMMFNGVMTLQCTEIFQNTSPNHYKIKLTYADKTVDIFEEDEIITVDSGVSKPAKKVTALDSLNGKQIWMVDKHEEDGQTAVCNLASINLSKINTTEDLARVVPTAIRMLDNVIDLNFYPLAKVKKTNEATRAIGLGVMGEAQMLAESKIDWGSEQHFQKIDEVMESVSYYAIKSSSDLAVEKGKYPTYEGSDWSRGVFPIDKANKEACKLVDRGGLFGYTHDWLELKEKVKRDGMRNGYLMAVAPTSSISILTGTTQAIEPVYKRKWFEENLSGLIPVVVPNLSPDTWEYYIPSYELDQNILVKAGAIRQKWIDQGQSLNIFISLDKASGRYLNEIYMNAWKYGLKSTYYLRSQSPESNNDIEDRSTECVGCQ